MASKILNPVPPYVQKHIEPIQHALKDMSFDLVSHLVAKHYRYPMWRCEVVYREPALMLDGKVYEFNYTLPGADKPIRVRKTCDHSKLRVLIFFVKHPDMRCPSTKDIDAAKLPQLEWKLVEEVEHK